MNNKIRLITVLVIVFTFYLIVSSPVQASYNNNSDLEWRLELIKASRALMEEESRDFYSNKFGIVSTNFGGEDSTINPGFRLSINLKEFEKYQLNLLSEMIYLRTESDLAGFLSLSIDFTPGLYIGAGGEILGNANYHVFTGWEIIENFFIELRAINTEGGLRDSRIYPFIGFQIKF